MDIKVYKQEDFQVSRWTGGTTKELAIFPETAKYLDRNFIWRLSTAICEAEETTFSKLPDYDRVLMVLEGNVVLAHQDVRAVRLGELEQDRFDGAYHTKSFGKITDYNLMVAKGNQGFLDVVKACEESTELSFDHKEEGFECFDVTLFCKDGFATVTVGTETLMLMPGQQLVANYAAEEEVKISVMGDGTLIRGQIFYNYHPEELGPTIIPKEPASFKDFKTCIFLSNTQFHGAKYIFKSIQKSWYDEQLSAAIKKVENLYLTIIAFLIGGFVIAFLGLHHFAASWQWIAAVTAWILIDFFIVSPLIYLPFMPKPVHKHIKDLDKLTPYEQRVYEENLGRNERLEKVMKKYEKSGRTMYDKDGNRIQ